MPRKSQTGGSLLGVAKSAGRFIKDKKLVSGGLGMIPHPAAQVASKVFGLFGLGQAGDGRKRKRGRKRKPVSKQRPSVQTGEGLKDWIKKGAKFVKDKKLISQGLSMINHPVAKQGAAVAKMVGLGRGRKKKLIAL